MRVADPQLKNLPMVIIYHLLFPANLKQPRNICVLYEPLFFQKAGELFITKIFSKDLSAI